MAATLLCLGALGLGLLAAVLVRDRGTMPAGTGRIRNVLILLVDTLRADHLGCYGYERDTSPHIDAFAREAVLFERAFSVSPWTRTSVVSLFTSLYPVAHGCQDKEDVAADSLQTMAEIFQAAGYRTQGFSSNVSVSSTFALDQGFEGFQYFDRAAWFERHPGRVDPGYVPIEGMVPDLLAWLDSVGDDPFFVYFHSTDPHWKYAPPAEFMRWGDTRAIDRYDGAIHYTDHYFAQIIEHLRAAGRLDDTVVIFTADHGEELWDHGRHGHGHSLYNELLEIPLIMRHPSFARGRRTAGVRLIDLLPTLVDLCGLEAAGAPQQGQSIAPLLVGGDAPADGSVFAEVMYTSKIDAVSYQNDSWKLIWTIEDRYGKRDTWELYDVARDRREKNDLASREGALLQLMAKRLNETRERHQRAAVQTEKSDMDEKTKEALRSLGYLQ